MALVVEHAYRYPAPSTVGSAGLRLATSGGPAEHPLFLRGTLARPRLAGDLLLALVQVVRSRFHVPAAMLARILAESDPVVTCAAGRVRFEGFSACCSAYARVDLLPEAVEGELLGPGTTNVDFNPEMRAALTGLRDDRPTALAVGLKGVELGGVRERKVPLPMRWLKGFIEAAAHQSRMTLRAEAGRAEALRFLRALPRAALDAWITPSLRVSQVPSPGAVRVRGLERLRLLEGLARHARALRLYAAPDGESSAWELDVPGARFHLALSPDVWRGFSGEGQVLADLADPAGEEALTRVRAALHWGPRLDEEDLARGSGLSAQAVRGALARLGARGLVGYDLAEAAWFHRVLPFDLARVEALQPRLRDARKLAAEGRVQLEGDEAWVRSADVEYRVRGTSCTCPWFARHAGSRGPCKHVLAVQLARGEEEG